jgi:uncharacterized membrane protein YiaA
MDKVKRFVAGLGLVCLLVGTVIALIGLYLKEIVLAITGFSFIAAGIIVMEFLHRKL